MADRKISDLTALTTPASGDYLPIVDISEAAASSKNKRITIEELFRGVPLGTAAAPSIAIEGDENTGIYSPGADQIGFSTNGTGRLFVDGAGRVGAGTANPQNEFEVFGSGNPRISIRSPESITEGPEIGFQFGTGANSSTNTLALIRAVPTQVDPSPLKGDLLFQTNPGDSLTERLRITSDGKLGLGTSVPGATLEVNGDTGLIVHPTSASTTGQIQIAGTRATGSAAVAIVNLKAIPENPGGDSDAASFAVETRASGGSVGERLRIDSQGRVGIGTTTASSLLSLGTSLANYKLKLYDGGDANDYGFGVQAGVLYYQSGGAHLFQTGGTERARIDSSGRLLVGTSSARSTSTVSWLSQIEGGATTGLGITTNNDSTDGAYLSLAKSRGTSVGSNTIVQNSDGLGYILFSGADGNDANTQAALIGCEVDGTPGADDMPGRLVFSTTADGSASPTERMRITSDAYVRLASGTGGIQFNGDTAAANALDDYEEGTWTVTFYDAASGGNASSTTATGYYTKIGDRISCNLSVSNIDTTGMTSGNTLYFSLPFTASASKSAHFGSVAIENINVNDATVNVTAHINASAARGYLLSSLDNAGFAAITVGNLTSGAADIWGSVIYC